LRTNPSHVEVEDSILTSVEDSNVVASGSVSIEVGLTINVGNIDLVNKVLELTEVED
jgi:hypothetical protein